MLNLAANLVQNLDICKKFSKNLVDERENMPRRGGVPRFPAWKLSHLISPLRSSVLIENRIYSPF